MQNQTIFWTKNTNIAVFAVIKTLKTIAKDNYTSLKTLKTFTTSFGDSESRPFREEQPETFISALHLYAPRAFCYALSTAGNSHWSGVFNLLKFDHISKKDRKTAKVA